MEPSLPREPPTRPAAGFAIGHRCLRLVGPLALGLSLGLQLTTSAFLLFGPSTNAPFFDDLTVFGKTSVRPEHDLAIYAAGILSTLAIILLADWWWGKRLACVQIENHSSAVSFGALVQTAAACGSLVLYLALVASRFVANDAPPGATTEPPIGLALLLPGAMAAGWAVIDLSYGWAYRGKGFESVISWASGANRLLPYAVPGLIVLLIGIPPGAWKFIAGREFVAERFYHPNFFMGPALSFAHGKAFATEIFAQYGIGWPLLCSWLAHFSAMTYGNFMALINLYGCVYYVALFFLLRSWFRQATWAALAVVLAVYWQVFSGVALGQVIWQYPSSTIARHAMDVWFFLVLMMHQRSGKTWWAGAAGMAAGVGIFLQTETGIHLCLAFSAYLVLLAGYAATKDGTSWRRTWLSSLLAFAAMMVTTLLPLLLYASRGTLFTAAFWQGWLGALFLYGSWGLSALPIAELPLSSMTLFLAMLATYLGVSGYAALRVLRREVTSGEVLLATLAVYGLAMLANFVARSHPHNLYHPAVPFAVILTALAFLGRKSLAGVLQHSSFPYVATSGLVMLLLTKPEVLSYPSLAKSPFQDTPPEGLSLTSNSDDICGLPPEYGQFVQEFRDVTAAIRTIAPDGKNMAIFDVNDTLLCYAANVCPWRPCAFIFQMALTQPAVGDVLSDLTQRPPKYVVTRGQSAPRSPNCDFIWAPLYEAVTNRYALVQAVGPYEIWALPSSGLAQCQAAEALLAKGQVAEAIARYTGILQLEPDLTAALNNLAWLRATHSQAGFRNGAEAVRLAERACRLTRYQQPMLVGTLAAAYAEAGRFEEAVGTAEKAHTLALGAGHNELAQRDQQLVDLFRARQAYREPGAN
jgi:hypothetical protein